LYIFSQPIVLRGIEVGEYQAMPFACAFFVKGYVQEDVLSGTKMLPNFKLRALNMPNCRVFGRQ
jgi:hypothetical protein